MSLAAACLPVGENSAIVAVKHALDQEEGTLFVDHALSRFGGEDVVEGEGLRLLSSVFFLEVDLLVLGVDGDHA